MTQAQALQILKTGRNVLLVGEAGAGKTHVLRQYLDYLCEHEVSVGVTASTGIAATHISGMTIHSWSGIGIHDSLTPQQVKTIANKSQVASRIKRAQVLVIDEISMLAAGQCDAIDQVMRAIRETQAPFGGLQVVLVGDFFQLPPISNEPQPPFVFTANVWPQLGLKVCYLHEQHRQSDSSLHNVLDAIRCQAIDELHYEVIAERIKPDATDDKDTVHLYTHNANVDQLNTQELTQLPGEPHSFMMESAGKKQLVESLVRGCLAPPELQVKKNAKVMFVKNNPDRGYVNGTTGTVNGFNDEGWPVVAIASGHECLAEPESWSVVEDGVEKASIRQVPLRLAWAITVHKSQGMTLDRAVMDLSRSFVPGMGYVALSRVQSLDGLILRGINNTAFLVHPLVVEFDQTLRSQSAATARQFQKLSAEQVTKLQQSFIDNAGKTVKKKEDTYQLTKQLVETGLSLKDIASGRDMTVETIIRHLGVIAEEYPDTDITRFRPAKRILTRVQQAYDRLELAERGKLSRLKAACPRISWNDLKLALVYINHDYSVSDRASVTTRQ